MSSKIKSAEAFERKVRAIYDALDSRSYKNALKQTEALLEKYKDNALLLILKAISLNRMGRPAEAHKICDAVLAHASELDEACIHVFKVALKDLKRPQDLTVMYEAMHKQNPTDTETMEALFCAYAREFQYVKQQQMAMKLLKQSGGQEQYHWWIVLSLMLQVRAALPAQPAASDTPLTGPPAQLLQLAESMAGRQVAKGNSIEGWEALLVYIDLLVARGQEQQALGVLQGPVGQGVAASEDERGAVQVDLLALCGKTEDARQLLVQRLRANPDDWAALCGYLDCTLPPTAPQPALNTSYLLWLEGGLAQRLAPPKRPEAPQVEGAPCGLSKAGVTLDKTLVATRLDEAAQLLSELCEAAGPLASAPTATTATDSAAQSPHQPVHRKCMRGPHLAKVELALRRVLLARHHPDLSSVDNAEQGLAEAILTYMEAAGQLVSCAADLRAYTRTLDRESAQWLYSQLSERHLLDTPADATPDTTPLSRDELRRRVCAHQLCADLHLPELPTTAAAVQYAVQLMQLYWNNQHLYQGLDDRERGPGDELPTLAVGALMEAACRTQDPQESLHLTLLSLSTLESVVPTRPYAPQIRLALLALYSLLGHPSQALAQHQALEIKSIQLDSLGSHHTLPTLLAYNTGALPPAAPTKTAATQSNPATTLPVTKMLHSTLALFRDHQRDAGDALEVAYGQGTYSKVLECIAFKERLDASHTFSTAQAEQTLAVLRTATAAAPSSTGTTAGSTFAKQLVSLLTEHPLPWAKLPTAAPAPTAAVAQSIRFNQDLSTRPGWYPPALAHPTLAHTAWWEGRQQCVSQARGAVAWWCSPGAAEADTAASGAWRSAQTQAVTARWCTVHALVHMLAELKLCDASGVPGLAPSAHTAITQLATALGCPQDKQLVEWLQQQVTAALPLSALLLLAACAVLAAGSALDGGGNNNAAHPASGSGVHTALQTAVSLIKAATEHVAAHLQTGHALPTLEGGVLAAATTLATETLPWMTAVLEATHDHTSKPKKAKKTQDAEAQPQGTESSASVVAVAKELTQAVASLHQALTAAQQHAAAGQGATTGDLCVCSGVDARALWVGGNSDGAVAGLQQCVSQLTLAQTELLGKVIARTSALLNRLQALA